MLVYSYLRVAGTPRPKNEPWAVRDEDGGNLSTYVIYKSGIISPDVIEVGEDII